jgi:hypothetical protein
LSAGRSFECARDATNSRSVRRAMIRIHGN